MLLIKHFNCSEFEANYHDRFKQTMDQDTCDMCGANAFTRRPDDNAETVRQRMAEYRAKTAPILPHYKARGLVRFVDGMAPIDQVSEAIEAIMDGSAPAGAPA